MRNLIFTLILGCLFFSCVEEGEDSIRLIPKGHIGPVLIVFNQIDGEPKEYEEDKRVYRIPSNGVLKTQFEPNYGVQNHQFFYVSSSGERTEIPFIVTQNKDSLSKIENRTKVYAYGESALGKGSGFDPEKGQFTLPHSREFYIGNILDIEKAYHDKIWFSKDQIQKFKVFENK